MEAQWMTDRSMVECDLTFNSPSHPESSYARADESIVRQVVRAISPVRE